MVVEGKRVCSVDCWYGNVKWVEMGRDWCVGAGLTAACPKAPTQGGLYGQPSALDKVRSAACAAQNQLHTQRDGRASLKAESPGRIVYIGKQAR